MIAVKKDKPSPELTGPDEVHKGRCPFRFVFPSLLETERLNVEVWRLFAA